MLAYLIAACVPSEDKPDTVVVYITLEPTPDGPTTDTDEPDDTTPTPEPSPSPTPDLGCQGYSPAYLVDQVQAYAVGVSYYAGILTGPGEVCSIECDVPWLDAWIKPQAVYPVNLCESMPEVLPVTGGPWLACVEVTYEPGLFQIGSCTIKHGWEESMFDIIWAPLN